MHLNEVFFSFCEIANLYVVNTSSSSAWTDNSQTYARPGAPNASYYYDTFELTVPIAGSYIITSSSGIDTYGYLYNGNFNPTSPALNLLVYDDDSGGDRQFRFTVSLRPSATYILVATTYSGNVTGPYTVVVSGLVRVNLVRTSNASTTQTTPTTAENRWTTETLLTTETSK